MSNLSSNHHQGRKYLPVERSSQKDTHRPSYQPLSHSAYSQTNLGGQIARYGSSTHLMPVSNRMKYSDVPRSPSASGLKTREEHLRTNIARRRNQGIVSNLKSELQNLKLEVSRIMNKDTDNNKTHSSRNSGVYSACEQYDQKDNAILGNYGKQIQDSVSVTSQKVIDEPLRKLQIQHGSQNYDHAHYLELENNLLKNQLRNLKNKYNATKQQLRQKCQLLQQKNIYLQTSLKKSQQALRECRRNLEIQMQTIRFQLNRKLQLQVEEDQRRNNEKINFPQRDFGNGNQLMQDKLKRLYEQVNEKSRIINNMNLQFNDVRGQLETKSFELKKQIQKNNEFALQLQFAKRQNSRNQSLLQQEIAKKMQLSKNVQALREKINQLSKQVHIKDQIVNNSQQFESKLNLEIQNYRQNQERLSNQVFDLQDQVRKMNQLNSTNQEQIRQLKITVGDFTNQIQQLSRNLRQQKQKNMEIQQSYRKMIDEIKQKDQRQMQQLQRQFERYRQASTETHIQKQQSFKQKVDTDIKQKDRQIGRWKAQYKMLKIKFQESVALQNLKRQQIQNYYRTYKEYKTKNKVLQMRNKVLQDSANQLISKIQKIQNDNLQERAQFLLQINNLNGHCQQFVRRVEAMELQINELRQILNQESARANSQQNLRKEIQQRVLNLDIDGNEGLMQIIEKIKKRVNDQDQKVNRYVKQLKNKQLLINKLRQQIRDVMQAQQRELQNFRVKQIQRIIHQIQSKSYITLQQSKNQSRKQIQIENANNNQLLAQNTQFKGQMAELAKQLMQLRQQAKSISHLYNIKSSQFQQIRDKHKVQIDNYEQKLQQLQKVKNTQIKNLQQQINTKNQQTAAQRNQIKMLNAAIMNLNRETFDEALKNQIESSKKLRQQINKKNQQVYRIRDSYALLKAEFDNLKSEGDINRLKFITQKKNIQVQGQVQCQQLRNLLSIQQKKVNSLQQKIKLVIDQNKKKDNFIQTYIMGKKLPTTQRQFIAAFLKQYQICVTGKNISEKLQTQSQELQKLTLYNFNLMKQIAQMKEKMLLYEAISIDNSHLGDSIAQFQSPTKRVLNRGSMPIDKQDLRR